MVDNAHPYKLDKENGPKDDHLPRDSCTKLKGRLSRPFFRLSLASKMIFFPPKLLFENEILTAAHWQGHSTATPPYTIIDHAINPSERTRRYLLCRPALQVNHGHDK